MKKAALMGNSIGKKAVNDDLARAIREEGGGEGD